MNTADDNHEMSEDIPNSDEAVFVPTLDSETRMVSVSSLSNIIVATSEGSFTAEQLQEAGIKTTHIVIHDQSTIDATLVKTPETPLTPSTPSTASVTNPLALVDCKITDCNRKLKYKWDPSVNDPVLPVRCRNVSGELHKDRFGSGGRGRCIKVADSWYTPSEFESIAGRASSKDWKRSIRFAGRTLQCLIEENILQPHAASCTCSACCDDNTVSGPVRLFTPYKRKRRRESLLSSQPESPKSCENSNSKEPMVVTIPTAVTSGAETLQVVTTPGSILNGTVAESVVVTPVATPQTPRNAPTALDFSEQRHWWQLEEMVKNLVRQVQEIQKQVELVKTQSSAARDAALQQLQIQMEAEKKEALDACRIEAQMTLSRAILEVKTEKEIAVQQAIQQARAGIIDPSKETMITAEKRQSKKTKCENCNREANLDCTRCHKVSYCNSFCQRRDWKNHQEQCERTVAEQQSAKTQN